MGVGVCVSTFCRIQTSVYVLDQHNKLKLQEECVGVGVCVSTFCRTQTSVYVLNQHNKRKLQGGARACKAPKLRRGAYVQLVPPTLPPQPASRTPLHVAPLA